MIRERKDIEAKYKWDLSVIYKDEAAFNADYALAEAKIQEFKAHEKTMLAGAEELYAMLSDMFAIEAIIEKLWSYASLNFAVDTSDNYFQALNTKVRSLAIMAGEASWFVTPYMLKLDVETVERYLKECPKLETYRRVIEKTMREKEHTLSDECEILMSKVQDAFGSHSNIRSIFTNSDLRFGKIRDENGKLVELTDTNYVMYLMSSDRRVRSAAFRCIYKTYAQFGNTFATLYEARVKESTTNAKVRNFANSITASTFRDEVTPEIYNNLIDAVHDGLPVLYDYYKLKREVLGVSKLHLYDIYAPLIGEVDSNYTYEEAVEEVPEEEVLPPVHQVLRPRLLAGRAKVHLVPLRVAPQHSVVDVLDKSLVGAEHVHVLHDHVGVRPLREYRIARGSDGDVAQERTPADAAYNKGVVADVQPRPLHAEVVAAARYPVRAHHGRKRLHVPERRVAPPAAEVERAGVDQLHVLHRDIAGVDNEEAALRVLSLVEAEDVRHRVEHHAAPVYVRAGRLHQEARV